MRTVQRLTGFMLLSWIPFACGPSFSRGDEDTIELSDVPAIYAESLCKAIDSCAPQYLEIFFGPNDCAALLAKKIEQASLPLIKTAVKAGTMDFDPSKLDKCTKKLEALGCMALENEYIQECEDVLKGKMPMGGKCTFDDECELDGYCSYPSPCPDIAPVGTCTTRNISGGPCRDDKECRTGLQCNDEGKCAAKLAKGEPCTANGVNCQGGLICGADAGSARTCVEVASVFSQPRGASCDIAKGTWCEQGSYCAVTSVSLASAVQTCVPPSVSGGACNFSVADMCPRNEYCAGTAIVGAPQVDIDGMCTLLPTDGEACSSKVELGKACARDHACVTNSAGSICRKWRKNGETCGDNAECYSESCVGTVCTPKVDCQAGG